MFAAGQADLGPLPGRVGLAARNAEPEPAGDLGDVLDLQRHQLGAAQRAGEAKQQQGPVAPAAGGSIAGGDQLAQHGQRQRGGFLWWPAVLAQQALQRPLDVAMGGVPGQVVEPVHFAQRGEAAADGGRGMGVGEAGEIGADGGRGGGDRHEAMRGAPGGEVRPVRLVGPERVGGSGLAGEVLRVGKRRGARLGGGGQRWPRAGPTGRRRAGGRHGDGQRLGHGGTVAGSRRERQGE